MFLKIFYTLLAIPALFIVLHTILRIVRHFYNFPIPQFMGNLIDNPLRRLIQPPDETALRHGVEPGMRVLDVGPGNGTYTLATARRVGPQGQVVAIDIEPKMIELVRRRMLAEGVTNVEVRLANVYDLPFEDASFDLIYLIAVIGEIPEPHRAFSEFRRVLKPNGRLVFSELLMDPDYPLASRLISRVKAAGFRHEEKLGNFFYYSLVFRKSRP